MNKVDSRGQENYFLLLTTKPKRFAKFFDHHNGNHGLPSTSIQNSNGISPLCNFKNLNLIAITNKINPIINQELSRKFKNFRKQKKKLHKNRKHTSLVPSFDFYQHQWPHWLFQPWNSSCQSFFSMGFQHSPRNPLLFI